MLLKYREASNNGILRAAREAVALAASLGGLDGFVFTAGIRQHAAEIRRLVCECLR